MTTPIAAGSSRPAPNDEQTFPKRTSAQVERVAAHGRLRHVEPCEELWILGKLTPKFFVVRTGAIRVVRPADNGEMTFRVIGPGEFTGEASMLAGRRALVNLRVSEPSDVIEVERGELLALVQTDAELSEIFVRAFLLRRAALIAGGLGDVVLVGSNHSSDTHRIKEFLTRNVHPYAFIDPDRDDSIQELLDRFNFAIASPRDQPARSVRGWRCQDRQHQTRCVSGRRGIDSRFVRASGAAGVR